MKIFSGLLSRQDSNFYLIEQETSDSPIAVRVNDKNFVFKDVAKLMTMTRDKEQVQVSINGELEQDHENKAIINPNVLIFDYPTHKIWLYRESKTLSEIPTENRCVAYTELAQNLSLYNKKRLCIEAIITQEKYGLQFYLVAEDAIGGGSQIDFSKSLMVADHYFVGDFEQFMPLGIGSDQFINRIRCVVSIEWLPWYNSFTAMNFSDVLIQIDSTNFLLLK